MLLVINEISESLCLKECDRCANQRNLELLTLSKTNSISLLENLGISESYIYVPTSNLHIVLRKQK